MSLSPQCRNQKNHFTHPYLYEQMICPPESLRYILSIVLSADNLYQTKKSLKLLAKKIKFPILDIFFPFSPVEVFHYLL